jgi:hypothetical protein
VPNQDGQPGLKDSYFDLLAWLQGYPNLGYWISLLSVSFITLLLMYLFVTNLRLHRHIRSLTEDKQRLMQEKDMMRQGMLQQQNSDDPNSPLD